ncbi:MAG: aminoacyl-histidine dipeptidase, partial [Lachnospiraceae bacterium]|nr:aminoacyl-histidine dipeptidase [Lachnospiraceae bacterium]
EKTIAVYKELYGGEPVVTGVHAGLECGILAEKIDGLEAVSIGPNIKEIHTTREKLDIQSTIRTWDFILGVLAKKD